MKKILIIHTDGTISMKEDEKTGRSSRMKKIRFITQHLL
jgi:L-asparaginase/Glu-tRNA(Gln) amidotransferase subunit D